MENPQLGNSPRYRSLATLTTACLLVACVMAVFIALYGIDQHVDSFTLPVAGRTLNGFMAIVLTCIALIVPLTANLYTPKLVTLYVSHPLIVAMLSVLLLSHIVCLSLNFVPTDHTLNHVLVGVLALIYLLVMMGALPFLYGISRFLRPTYFMPMLTKKGIRSLSLLASGRKPLQSAMDMFETIDVVTNIALTGMTRGDRQLVLLSLQSLHTFLSEIIGNGWEEPHSWRDTRAFFVPGLAHEGQDYLTRERVWPEAYILAQMLKVMESATHRQHEILAELASQLVESAQLASILQRDKVTELIIMTFNTLMREVIEVKDLRRFQNLSYYYRLLIETFHDQPERMHESAQHLIHYAKMANKLGVYFAMETVIYDMGETVLSLAGHDQERAVELVQAWAGPLWQDSIDGGTHMKKIAWRAILRVFWEAKVLKLETLTESLYWRYLSDETIHREQVELVLDENRELHYEFNDRLMRFAHLSPEAELLAREFCEG
jgi:hypothetical protein